MAIQRYNRTICRKLCGIALILLMLAAIPAYGENGDEAPAKWSLQFGIERDFQLGEFDGMQISIRKHCSAQKAWRLGASFNCLIANGDIERHSYDEVNMDILESDFRGFEAVLSLIHEWHPLRSKSIRAIIGCGPELGLETSNYEIDQPGRLRAEDIQAYHAGLRGVFGAEWFVAKQISLIGEYALSIVYSHESTVNTNEYTTRSTELVTKKNSFELATNSVNFGVSVYF